MPLLPQSQEFQQENKFPPLVDLTGFEPVISAMRMRRITNCATGPLWDGNYVSFPTILPTKVLRRIQFIYHTAATICAFFGWTRGELNPFLLHAMESFYRYTTGPYNNLYYIKFYLKNCAGFTATPFIRVSKWRCVPVDRPVEPILAMTCPRDT